MIGDIALLGALLVLYALLAVGGAAVLNVNAQKVRQNAESGDGKARRLQRFTDRPSELQLVLQICAVLTCLCMGVFIARLFTVAPFSDIAPREPAFWAAIVVLIFFMLFLGELTPKKLAVRFAEAAAYAFLPLLSAVFFVLTPFVRLLLGSVGLLMKALGFKGDVKDDVTEQEIRLMMDAGGETGNLDVNEIEMINNVFEFNDMSAAGIARHRTEIMALPSDIGLDALVELISNEKYSRFPLYEENIDNIIGILHIKDVMRYAAASGGAADFDIKAITRKPYFVPMSKKADELFNDMRKNKAHMAIVVDEYGGTFGLLTMEDLIEEIMGSILDEYDEEETPQITALDETTYGVNGTADLEYVAENLKIELPVSEYDTLSGFMVAQLGRIPNEGENPEFEFNGALFKVSRVEENRIESAVVCKL